MNSIVVFAKKLNKSALVVMVTCSQLEHGRVLGRALQEVEPDQPTWRSEQMDTQTISVLSVLHYHVDGLPTS